MSVRQLFVAACCLVQLGLTANACAGEYILLTACRIITESDARKFVGGPLETNDVPEVKTDHGPDPYNSSCSYVSKDGSFANMLGAQRAADVMLHILDTPEATATIYERTVIDYQRAVIAPDTPYKNATITPIGGFGVKAFILEATTDERTGYRSALLVFYKGRIAGSIAAWKKPEPPLELTKAVAKFVIDKLP